MKPRNVTKLVEEARKGNIMAKEELIKRYLHLVTKYVEEYDGILEKTDLYQEAVVVLILKLNRYLKEDFHATLGTYLHGSIEAFFEHTVNRMEREYGKIKEGDVCILEDSSKYIDLVELKLSLKTKDN